MNCPRCKAVESRVIKTERPLDESVQFPEGTLKRRRRRCKDCRRPFFTYEIHEEVFRRMLSLTEGTPIRRPLRTRRA